MIDNLEKLGVPYTTRPGSRSAASGENSWGKRDYSGGHYTYIHDPDGNMIELVHHPLGLEDAEGNKIEVAHYTESPRWGKYREFSSTPS